MSNKNLGRFWCQKGNESYLLEEDLEEETRKLGLTELTTEASIMGKTIGGKTGF